MILSEDTRETLREIRYYRHLQRRGISWEMIPEYHGTTPTNHGLGYLFDLVLDVDGGVAKSLAHYLSKKSRTEDHFAELSISLPLLKAFLLKNRIITKPLCPRNILLRRSASGSRLVIVDDIGNTDFVPICTHSRFFATKKILRRWGRFEVGMLKCYQRNEPLRRLLTGAGRPDGSAAETSPN